MANEKMTLRGFNADDVPCDIVYEQPYSDSSVDKKHYGMPITPCAFIAMIDQFRREIDPNDPTERFRNVYWVEFSKASIFRILAQEQCDYLRFHLALPDATIGNATLAIEGVKEGGNAIEEEQMIKIADEMKRQVAQEGRFTEESEILRTLTKGAGQREEKGNGGTLVTEVRNIKTIKDFIAKKVGITKMSTSEFIKEFYKYANEQF